MLNEKILLHNQSKMTMNPNVTGKKIREIRKSKKITQKDMIARLQLSGLDMSRSTYSKVELEIRQVRDFELIAFAKALKVDVSEFFK
ncbi:helix-turn-helix domain-containing protein [Vibrio parahaemolyticus]|uniref:helix-turn-helix domain-containing protein n=2 Tax=Vibrio TaxID=662 RepID=UPI00215D3AF1|nr:helix-turn-helix transcriptional regulator [Vibrio parahaemolyticus]EJE4188524.1 helix-turn-helix transcriptional regulator [Vibrio parahaemolyticus]EKH9202489.1 helix-turn-helix transcriptional regulator [Vibrio parahaemolyticus]ELB2121765.1 helix-turn-helix transcriptional regulator [Vibrio parahaemolyticus]MCR9726327.1 helix-turn-helix domain-containing protein [Vibrio parahaemolyticus]MCR9745008.1 helix-turn-helix domain-containing protein [Vibrio parahaemolyticus]